MSAEVRTWRPMNGGYLTVTVMKSKMYLSAAAQLAMSALAATRLITLAPAQSTTPTASTEVGALSIETPAASTAPVRSTRAVAGDKRATSDTPKLTKKNKKKIACLHQCHGHLAPD